MTYIVLLRGVNVGGKNLISMKDFSCLLSEIKLEKIQTYLQSGNAIFSSDLENSQELARKISASMKKNYEFEIQVLVLSLPELNEGIHNNPFPQAVSNPPSLHAGFLWEKPVAPNLGRLEELRKGSEQFRLIGKIFYLFTPEGIGRSPLASKSEALLGVSMTNRNWRTVLELQRRATLQNQPR